MAEHHNIPGQQPSRPCLQTQLQNTLSLLAQSRAKRRARGLRLNNSLKASLPVVLLGSAAALAAWFWLRSAVPAVTGQQRATADDNSNNHQNTKPAKTLPHHGLEASLRWLFAMLLTGRSLMQAARFLLAFFTTKKSA